MQIESFYTNDCVIDLNDNGDIETFVEQDLFLFS